MRGLLRFLILVAVLVGIGVLLVVQLLIPAIVTAEVRAAIPVSATPIAVDVRTSLTGVLLHGRIDSITVSGSNVRRGLVTAAAMDITVGDVGIIDRSFGTVTGALSGVQLDQGIHPPMRLTRVTLSGSATRIQAAAELSPADLETELELAIAGVGSDPVFGSAHVSVAGGVIHVEAGTNDVAATLRLENGAIVLDGGPLGSLTLATPPADGSWQVTNIQLTPAGARITAEVPTVLVGQPSASPGSS